MERKKLISYAIKYDGNFDLIMKAIQKESEVQIVDYENAITIIDEDYPKCFLELKYPPLVLFYKGNKELLKEQYKIGVVGSRKPTDYALKATKDLVLANKDKVVVSGLAKGIDATAHKSALKTIGILGCGIDYYYPMCNKDLIDEVSKHHLLLSEYPGMVKPLSYHFPFRNRLIAALSNTLYVMELKERSGTMTSVNEALELGKEVKVLPFDIYSSREIFNNKLINEGSLVIDTSEIFL